MSIRTKRVAATSTSCLAAHPDGSKVSILPLNIVLDGQTHKDGIDLSSSEFIQWMTNNPNKTASTEPPSNFTICKFIEEHVKEGCEELIIVTLSRKLSETYNRIEKIAPTYASKIKVRPYDSEFACLTEGLLALKAERLFEQGKSLDETIKELDKIRSHSHVAFSINKLETLIATGKLSSASGFVANLLDIKPVLEFSNGEVEPVSKTRSINKAIQKMIDQFKEQTQNKTCTPYIMHSGNTEILHLATKALEEQTQHKNIMQSICSPVIMTYAGTDLIGLGYTLED